MNTFRFSGLFVLVQKAIAFALLTSVLVACSSNAPKDDDLSDEVIEPEVLTSAVNDANASDVSTDGADEAVMLETVFYFDFDQSVLTSATRAALDEQAAALRGSNAAVRLEGHADERGSREYNLALGERRAQAIADYLAIQGVSRARIEVVSYGEERPVTLGTTESDYAQNRRVELK